jgi:hypothetical protein
VAFLQLLTYRFDLLSINFEQLEPKLVAPELIEVDSGIRRSLLCRNQYYVTERVEMEPGSVFEGKCNGDSLEIWGVLDGAVHINDVPLDGIRFALLPAAMGEFNVTTNSNAMLLRTYVEAIQ